MKKLKQMKARTNGGFLIHVCSLSQRYKDIYLQPKQTKIQREVSLIFNCIRIDLDPADGNS